MSYVVLARKYRPPNFSAMVGQEHVVQALTNALTQRRLHHAYLFTGTRGVGKTTVSRILAKSLNCTGADGSGDITATPCGVCDACRDIDAGRFVDYVELDAASNRGVEEITQLLDQAVYKPVVGRFKVYMIDEVHMLSNTAFNAMLKTLEEPPEYLKFVLATTDPQKVPPTVLSRCLQFNLRPMAPQTVHEHLADVLVREGIAAEPGALHLLARAARGSMRDALSLTDQAIAYGAGTLTEAGVRGMLGAVDRSHAVRIVEALAAGGGVQLVAAADALRGLGLSAAATLEELAMLLQQMAVLQAVPDALDTTDPDAPETARLAGLLAADETQLYYSIALNGRAELALAPDEYSGLVMVLLRMLAFRPQGSGAATRAAPRHEAPPAKTAATAASATVARAAPLVASAPAAASVVPAPVPIRKPASRADEPPPWVDAPFEDEVMISTSRARGDVPANAGAPAAPSASYAPAPAVQPPRVESPVAPPFVPQSVPTFATEGLGARWAELVGRMAAAGSVQAMARELAVQSQCVAFDEREQPLRCVLRVEREMLRNGTHVEKLQTALTETLGRAVRLEVQAGTVDDSPARREAAERARRQAEAEQIVYSDPLVQALMKEFKTARIVPGSIRPH